MNGCSFSACFTAKFDLVFVLTQENTFSWRFDFKSNEGASVHLQCGTWDFQNSSPFERSACFYVTITANFEHFHYFNSGTNFLKKENLFKKIGVPFFSRKFK